MASMLLAFGEIEDSYALIWVQPIDLVPNLKQSRIVRFNAEPGENLRHVIRLCFRIVVGDVAHVQDHVRFDHFFKGGAESRTSMVGRSEMNPTVSERMTRAP